MGTGNNGTATFEDIINPAIAKMTFLADDVVFTALVIYPSLNLSGAVEKTRTSTDLSTATSTLRVYQFRHDRKTKRLPYFEAGDFFAPVDFLEAPAEGFLAAELDFLADVSDAVFLAGASDALTEAVDDFVGDADFFADGPALDFSTSVFKISGFSTTSFAKIFLSTETLAFFRPAMNVEYFMPSSLTAALIL